MQLGVNIPITGVMPKRTGGHRILQKGVTNETVKVLISPGLPYLNPHSNSNLLIAWIIGSAAVPSFQKFLIGAKVIMLKLTKALNFITCL